MHFIMTEKHFVVKQSFHHHSIFYKGISKMIHRIQQKVRTKNKLLINELHS